MRVEPYLMFADLCEEALAFCRRAIDVLAEGGSVFMPMGTTFWSPCFGMCSDRFGVHWMVGLDGPQTRTPGRRRMHYIDGFVVAVPDAQRDVYVRYAGDVARVFKEYGALHVVECWDDDVPEGKLTPFPMAVKREPGESVAFAWIVWPDKATRDAGHPKMQIDPRVQDASNTMPSTAGA